MGTIFSCCYTASPRNRDDAPDVDIIHLLVAAGNMLPEYVEQQELARIGRGLKALNGAGKWDMPTSAYTKPVLQKAESQLHFWVKSVLHANLRFSIQAQSTCFILEPIHWTLSTAPTYLSHPRSAAKVEGAVVQIE